MVIAFLAGVLGAVLGAGAAVLFLRLDSRLQLIVVQAIVDQFAKEFESKTFYSPAQRRIGASQMLTRMCHQRGVKLKKPADVYIREHLS